jgi:protein FAM32A
MAKMSSKTPAQMKFDLIRKKRLLTRVQDRMKLTHKERVEKFNTDLSRLSEHYDIPKIGPG